MKNPTFVAEVDFFTNVETMKARLICIQKRQEMSSFHNNGRATNTATLSSLLFHSCKEDQVKQ